jgi:uncharacterized membrane protein
MYGTFLFLHLLGVALLVGSVTATLLTTLRVQTAGTVRELRSLVAGTKLGEFFIVPAMLIIIGSGVYLVVQHDHGGIPWSAGWLVVSLALTLVVTVIGGTVEGSDDRRLRAAIASAPEEGPHEDLRAVQLAARPIYVLFFSTSQVLALLFLMSNRPSLAVSIAACVIAAVASVVVASIRIRAVRRVSNVPVG